MSPSSPLHYCKIAVGMRRQRITVVLLANIYLLIRYSRSYDSSAICQSLNMHIDLKSDVLLCDLELELVENDARQPGKQWWLIIAHIKRTLMQSVIT